MCPIEKLAGCDGTHLVSEPHNVTWPAEVLDRAHLLHMCDPDQTALASGGLGPAAASTPPSKLCS